MTQVTKLPVHHSAESTSSASEPRIRHILVVCTGNICRSPMGEVVLQHRLEQAGLTDVTVSSAGVSAEESGNSMDSRARWTLKEAGYRVPRAHRAHRATPHELRDADLVLAMTLGHARALKAMLLDASAELSKVHLWKEFDGTVAPFAGGVFAPGAPLDPAAAATREAKRSRYSDFYTSDGALDVADPWYGPAEGFKQTLREIEAGAAGVVAFLGGE